MASAVQTAQRAAKRAKSELTKVTEQAASRLSYMAIAAEVWAAGAVSGYVRGKYGAKKMTIAGQPAEVILGLSGLALVMTGYLPEELELHILAVSAGLLGTHGFAFGLQAGQEAKVKAEQKEAA